MTFKLINKFRSLCLIHFSLLFFYDSIIQKYILRKQFVHFFFIIKGDHRIIYAPLFKYNELNTTSRLLYFFHVFCF